MRKRAEMHPEHAELLDLVTAFGAAWRGPDNDLLPPSMQPVHMVAHRDPESGLVTFHMRGLPQQLAYLLAAVRAYTPPA